MYPLRLGHTAYRLAAAHPLCNYLDKVLYNCQGQEVVATGVDSRAALTVSRPLTEAPAEACTAMWALFKAAARELQAGKSSATAGVQVETYSPEHDAVELVSVPYFLFMAAMAYDSNNSGDSGSQTGGTVHDESDHDGSEDKAGAGGEGDSQGSQDAQGAETATAASMEPPAPSETASKREAIDDPWNVPADTLDRAIVDPIGGQWSSDRGYVLPSQRSDYRYYSSQSLGYTSDPFRTQRPRRSGFGGYSSYSGYSGYSSYPGYSDYPGPAPVVSYVPTSVLHRLISLWKAREPFDFSFSRTLRLYTPLLLSLRIALPRIIFPTLDALQTEFRVFEPPSHILKNQLLCFCTEFMDLFSPDTEPAGSTDYGPLRLSAITDITTKYVGKRRALFAAISDMFGTVALYSPEFQREYYKAIKHPVFLDNIRTYCRQHKRKGFEVTEVYSFFLLLYRLCCNAVQYNWPLDDVFLGQKSVRSEFEVTASIKKVDNPDGNVFFLAIYLANSVRKMMSSLHERLVLGRAYLLRNRAKEIEVPEDTTYQGGRGRGHGSSFSKSGGASKSQKIRPEALNALLIIGFVAAEEEYCQVDAILKKDIIKVGCSQREQRMEELRRATAAGRPIDLATEDRSDMGLTGVIEIPPSLTTPWQPPPVQVPAEPPSGLAPSLKRQKL